MAVQAEVKDAKIKVTETKKEDGKKEVLVKRTVSNGLVKNNFSYATVRTETAQVGDKPLMTCHRVRPCKIWASYSGP